MLGSGCEPLAAPAVTQQVLIITAIPSPTASPTATSTATRTPIPTLTRTPTATPDAPACPETAGQVIPVDQFRSPTANENLRYRVYVPPCYFQSGRRYPVVYLIHGAAQREQKWEDLGMLAALDTGIATGTLPPMILVMPYYGTIGNLSQFPPDPSYETVILEELLPAVQRDFCTVESSRFRAIAGLSRGGFWAYSIGLRHPEVFGIVAGHSPYFTDDLAEVPAAFNPGELAAALTPQISQRLYLDNGAQDPSGRSIQRFSTALTERSVPHTYTINPIGDHNDEYWSTHVAEYLAFYGRTWPRDTAQLPSCLAPSPP